MNDSTRTPIDTVITAPVGDHDQPYDFGRRPTVKAPFPFSTRQYGRLLILRGRLEAAQLDAAEGAA